MGVKLLSHAPWRYPWENVGDRSKQDERYVDTQPSYFIGKLYHTLFSNLF